MYKIPETYLYLSAWNDSINLRQVGTDKPYPGYQYGPATREYYLIHVITKGRGVYHARGTKYALKAGDAFLIHPNEITVYTADQENPWEYYFFSFSGAMAQDLLQNMGFIGDRIVLPCAADEIATLIMDCVNTIDGTAVTDHLASLEHLFRIVTAFSRNTLQTSTNELQTNHYIRKAIAYIELNYANNITVNDLARTLSIDRSYLYRVFKEGTGMSPKEYLNTHRLNVARSLLEETDYSIAEIALSAGFFSFSAFYRSFVKKYDQSPREYQRAFRSNKTAAKEKDNK